MFTVFSCLHLVLFTSLVGKHRNLCTHSETELSYRARDFFKYRSGFENEYDKDDGPFGKKDGRHISRRVSKEKFRTMDVLPRRPMLLGVIREG